MVYLLWQWDWGESPSDFVEIWHSLGLMPKWVVVVLLVMIGQVVLTSALAAVRHVSARWQSRRLVLALNEALESGRFEDLVTRALKFKKRHVGAILAAGLGAFREFPLSLGDAEARECVERAMSRVLAIRTAEMRLGLSRLKTIAATAPLIGMVGTIFGILNSFRGVDESSATGLMIFGASFYIALMLTALGLVVAMLAMWSHDCLAKMSNILSGNVGNTTFEMMKRLCAHPEWRDDRESDIRLEPIETRDGKAHPWEVAYDRYRLLPFACVVELCFYAVMTIMLGSTRTEAGDAFAIGVCFLLAVGIIALSIWVTRHKGAFAAGQDADVAERFYYKSVERRLRARLPLKKRLAGLPDRSLVSVMPILVCMLVFALIDHSHSIPKGIPVAIAPAGTEPVSKMSSQAVVVQVLRAPRTDAHTSLLRLQNKSIARDELRQQLKNELAGREDRAVYIYGDRELAFQTVAEAVDAVKESGGTPLLVGNAKAK